jgi:hypothetical protein
MRVKRLRPSLPAKKKDQLNISWRGEGRTGPNHKCRTLMQSLGGVTGLAMEIAKTALMTHSSRFCRVNGAASSLDLRLSERAFGIDKPAFLSE